ncbi:MBG domain-containing protein, partial [Pediococcus damnosus]
KDVTLASGGYEYLDADGNVVTSPKNAGNYTIKLTESGIKAVTDANSDYDLGDLSKIVNKATISRAKATLTVTSNDDVTYDGKAHSLEVVSKGAVNGETITYTTDHNSNTNVGQYDVIVIADDTAVNENYDITVVKGSMTIVKATTPEGEISIGNAQGENINKTYDDKTFDENPVVQGPEIDVTLETGDYEYLGVNGNVVKDPVNAGDYQVRLTESGIDKVKVANSNYDLG